LGNIVNVMSLSANLCFKKAVYARDKTLGMFVNLVLDKESLEARIVVFPKLKGRKRLRGALGSLESLGSSIISTVAYDVPELASTASSIATDAAFEASRSLGEKIYDKTQEEAAMYYLLPVSEISDVKKGEILLDKGTQEYELYMGMKGTDTDIAFFNDEMYKDPDRYAYISLNLVTIRGLSVKDPENRKGRIMDVMFNPLDGVATHLVVTTIGRGAQPRLVDLDSVDFTEMTVSKKLEEYPVAES